MLSEVALRVRHMAVMFCLSLFITASALGSGLVSNALGITGLPGCSATENPGEFYHDGGSDTWWQCTEVSPGVWDWRQAAPPFPGGAATGPVQIAPASAGGSAPSEVTSPSTCAGAVVLDAQEVSFTSQTAYVMWGDGSTPTRVTVPQGVNHYEVTATHIFPMVAGGVWNVQAKLFTPGFNVWQYSNVISVNHG